MKLFDHPWNRSRLGLLMFSLFTFSLFTLSLCGVLVAGSPVAAAERDFPRPESLKPAIEFWRKVFSTTSQHQVVVHDAWYLSKIYTVLDFRSYAQDGEPLDAELEAMKRTEVEDAKQRIRQTLLRLHAAGPRPEGLSRDEQKIYDLYRDVPDGDKFFVAAERIRSQSGLREKFAKGIAIQHRYLAEMERILNEEDVPEELVHLPLIESSFNVEAYSKAGAAGIWQFMPATGRQYMRVGPAIDERRDPLRSTEAAARHLRSDYEALDSWPLAITAYNHGRVGVARGARQVGSDDIGRIVARYQGPAFGFASRNFYAEFLAALDVVARQRELFPELRLESPIRSREIELTRAVGLHEAARQAGLSRDELLEHNPALMGGIATGRAMIPRGYRLRVPGGSAAEPRVQVATAQGPSEDLDSDQPRAEPSEAREPSVAYASSSPRRGKAASVSRSSKSRSAQASNLVVHRVKRGQTLIDIARRYGTTVALIQGVNGIRQAKSLQPGQRLKIPQGT